MKCWLLLILAFAALLALPACEARRETRPRPSRGHDARASRHGDSVARPPGARGFYSDGYYDDGHFGDSGSVGMQRVRPQY